MILLLLSLGNRRRINMKRLNSLILIAALVTAPALFTGCSGKNSNDVGKDKNVPNNIEDNYSGNNTGNNGQTQNNK
jgi:hypothetical protein